MRQLTRIVWTGVASLTVASTAHACGACTNNALYTIIPGTLWFGIAYLPWLIATLIVLRRCIPGTGRLLRKSLLIGILATIVMTPFLGAIVSLILLMAFTFWVLHRSKLQIAVVAAELEKEDKAISIYRWFAISKFVMIGLIVGGYVYGYTTPFLIRNLGMHHYVGSTALERLQAKGKTAETPLLQALDAADLTSYHGQFLMRDCCILLHKIKSEAGARKAADCLQRMAQIGSGRFQGPMANEAIRMFELLPETERKALVRDFSKTFHTLYDQSKKSYVYEDPLAALAVLALRSKDDALIRDVVTPEVVAIVQSPKGPPLPPAELEERLRKSIQHW